MEKKVKLSIETARQLYKEGGSAKMFALDNYSEKELSEKLSDRIKSYNDACNELNYQVLTISNFSHLPPSQRERAFYMHQIETIIECFNDGWKPDFKNSNQYKYYVWFERKSSGWVFYGVSYRYGSRFESGLYFKNREDAEYVGKQFLSIYNKILE